MKIKRLYLLTSSIALPCFVPVACFAAACCGGGFATPSLIVGDDKAQLTTSVAYSQVVDDVGADSIWWPRSSDENSQTYMIQGARIFQDRWQAGLGIPVVTRSLGSDSSSGLGDVSGTLGYEYLPDWDYNPWRPRGLGFLQLTIPTGKSINESDDPFQLDSRGRGFWAIGIGTILTKTIHKWDIFTEFDVHQSFAKSYSNSQSQGVLSPGYGGNLGIGGGYNLASLRFGSGLTWTYEDPINVTGTINSSGAPQRLATATLSASYLFPENWSGTLVYSDQTLFGSPVNTSLGRGIALSVQKRWER